MFDIQTEKKNTTKIRLHQQKEQVPVHFNSEYNSSEVLYSSFFLNLLESKLETKTIQPGTVYLLCLQRNRYSFIVNLIELQYISCNLSWGDLKYAYAYIRYYHFYYRLSNIIIQKLTIIITQYFSQLHIMQHNYPNQYIIDFKLYSIKLVKDPQTATVEILYNQS